MTDSNFMKPFSVFATLISFSLGPWRHIVAMLLFLCVSRAAYIDQQVGIVRITSRILGVRLIQLCRDSKVGILLDVCSDE
jgi:hypothetical protein